jgi:aminopeptidase N
MKLFLFLAVLAIAQNLNAQTLIYESGGELTPELSAFNVHHYELDLEISPSDSSVSGTVAVHFETVHPANKIALALDPKLSIANIYRRDGDEKSLEFTRDGSDRSFFVHFPSTLQPGERVVLDIEYGGKPLVASNPPWGGGMVWEQTPSGEPWLGVACQTIGAWVWWPNKDHPSDRPDSVAINITMPDDLVVASNGRSRGVTDHENGKKTWHWFVSTPINNYNVTFNAAPYETISETYTSIAGDDMEMTFWVLPEFLDEGKKLFPQFKEQMEFMEQIAGPYPFRADKYGVAHAPYLGMEHQSLIAYGAGFEDGALFGSPAKFDDLHQHELAHEWWGNLVTVWDWRDFWIHEGFGTYMQALYAEHVSGEEDYRAMIRHFESRITSMQPTAPRERMTTREITGGGRGGDIYFKGAVFLHTLRYYMGDDLFFESIRRFAYPDPAMEQVTDGSHMRYATTDDYLTLVNKLAGENLDWLFEAYLRTAEIPQLHVRHGDNEIILQWLTAAGSRFNMPVEVYIDGEMSKAEPENAVIKIDANADKDIEIDPYNRILMELVEEEEIQKE